MSRFFSKKHALLQPYTPGEQPGKSRFVKLNTNESPFPPSSKAIAGAGDILKELNLYSDPDMKVLRSAIADVYGISSDQVTVTNGSDEFLNFCFLAFTDDENQVYFPDITYGFYPVFGEINHVSYHEIPLKEDLSIDISDYMELKGTILIANPNAPTGIALKRNEIEELVKADPERLVIIDEAYVDFGAESCVPLINKYDNLIVVQTFSKSRSLAGARLGFGFGAPDLIRDIDTIRYSTNPYNVNSVTQALGTGAMMDEEYTRENSKTIIKNREYTAEALKELGFSLTESRANFLFVRSPEIGGEELYQKLKERGILIRHFTKERISEYNRITIGSMEQMNTLISGIKSILEEKNMERKI